MAVDAGQRGKRELWLHGLAAIPLAAMLIFTAWVVLTARRPRVLGPTHGDPKVVVQAGQSRFNAETLAPGDVVLCESNGLQVDALVPRRGRNTSAHLANGYSSATVDLSIRTLRTGGIVVVCS
jgi:hypothetical protein